MSNLLAMVQGASNRIGLPVPSSVIGSNDAQVRQLLGLAQQEGKELSRRYAWQAITKEKTFTTVAAEVQTNAIPADFDRFINGTFFNRTRTRLVAGPLTPQEYQDYKGRLASIVYDAFRVRGNDILILPTPAAGWTMAYEYVSTYWCTNASGTTERSEWAADDDVPLLDSELMTLGIVWRFYRAKGLDYSEAFRSYEMQVAALTGRDGGRRTLNMAVSRDKRVPRAPIPPDGSWSL